MAWLFGITCFLGCPIGRKSPLYPYWIEIQYERLETEVWLWVWSMVMGMEYGMETVALFDLIIHSGTLGEVAFLNCTRLSRTTP